MGMSSTTFEQFRYDISVRARRARIRLHFAHHIFDTLHARTSYRLVLVDDVQVVLASGATR